MRMVSVAILSGLILLPLVLVLVLRAHGAIVFMSLCLGSVLMAYASPDVTDFLTEFFSVSLLETEQWVKLGLLTLPVLLTLLFTRKTITGGKQLFNFLPALTTGMLLALLAMPLFPSGVQQTIEGNDAWNTLSNLQTAVLLGGSFFSLVFILVTNRSPSEEKSK